MQCKGKHGICDHPHMGSVNRRTARSTARRPQPPRGSTHRSAERRSQAERRRQTRQALLDAALEQMDGGYGFDSLSLRRVTRAAGVVPTAFYRHFDSMDELGLALVEESVATLRAMLREAREGGAAGARVGLIARSVEILVAHVREHRRHFAFMAARPGVGQRRPAPRHPLGDQAVRLRAGHRPRPLPHPARLDHRRPADAGRPVRRRDDRHDRRDPGCLELGRGGRGALARGRGADRHAGREAAAADRAGDPAMAQ